MKDQVSSLIIEFGCLCFLNLFMYLFFYSFISLLMDRILDKNPFENTLMRKMVRKFSFNIKATSTINHDYRKFPLW